MVFLLLCVNYQKSVNMKTNAEKSIRTKSSFSFFS